MPAAAEGVTNRLEVVSSEALKLKEGQDKSVKAVEAWVSKFTKKNGREPTVKDRSVRSQREKRERKRQIKVHLKAVKMKSGSESPGGGEGFNASMK